MGEERDKGRRGKRQRGFKVCGMCLPWRSDGRHRYLKSWSGRQTKKGLRGDF